MNGRSIPDMIGQAIDTTANALAFGGLVLIGGGALALVTAVAILV